MIPPDLPPHLHPQPPCRHTEKGREDHWIKAHSGSWALRAKSLMAPQKGSSNSYSKGGVRSLACCAQSSTSASGSQGGGWGVGWGWTEQGQFGYILSRGKITSCLNIWEQSYIYGGIKKTFICMASPLTEPFSSHSKWIFTFVTNLLPFLKWAPNLHKLQAPQNPDPQLFRKNI